MDTTDAPLNAKPFPNTHALRTYGLGISIWLVSGLALHWMDGHISLGNMAMVLVLASALAGLWLPRGLSFTLCAAAVMAFNWAFVPPRGTLSVNLASDLSLLLTLLVVSWIITWLMARQRAWATQSQQHARQSEQLRAMSELLRDTDDPALLGPQLCQALSTQTHGRSALWMLNGPMPRTDDMQAGRLIGDAGADELTGLWLCLREGAPLGPGTGRHEEFDAWLLPMRGRNATYGAALLLLPQMPAELHAVRAHAQALCDQMGLALERSLTWRAAVSAREQAQAQSLRNTLLAAISHDYRTPLATIMGAASSLRDQADKLSSEQCRRLAATVVDEAEQLRRMTDNTLQLARLDSPHLQLQMDWESVEEIIGTVLRRVRPRDHQQRVRARVEPQLPLLRCDALLLAQMLDNLVDNALKYGEANTPVEILATRNDHQLTLAVRDRGPRIPSAWKERIFEVFQRAERLPTAGTGDPQRGAGVGLAVCRAIARAHGGDLTLRARSHGGSSFECCLPIDVQPSMEGAALPPARQPKEEDIQP